MIGCAPGLWAACGAGWSAARAQPVPAVQATTRCWSASQRSIVRAAGTSGAVGWPHPCARSHHRQRSHPRLAPRRSRCRAGPCPSPPPTLPLVRLSRAYLTLPRDRLAAPVSPVACQCPRRPLCSPTARVGGTPIPHAASRHSPGCGLLGVEANRLDSYDPGRGRSFPGTPSARRNAMPCHPPGLPRSWANAPRSNASLAGPSSSSVCSALWPLAGRRSPPGSP